MMRLKTDGTSIVKVLISYFLASMQIFQRGQEKVRDCRSD